jgi:hypothetical protein
VGIFDRFELLDLLRDDGIRTFDAREKATGRRVQVHLFAHANARNVAALAQLDRLPEQGRRHVIDRGENAGVPYVVTGWLGDRMGFREWLAALDPAPPTSDLSLDEQFLSLLEAAGPKAKSGSSAAPSPPANPPPQSEPAVRSLLAFILGIAAALLFLVAIIGFIALRPL